MTVLDSTTHVPAGHPDAIVAPTMVAADLYKDIHKGLRAELFAVTSEAGSLDPSDADGRAALAHHVGGVADLLRSHAEHEDAAVQPVLERELPDLAAIIERDHRALEARVERFLGQAGDAVSAPDRSHRAAVHHLYLELASFTGEYLTHQDVEERKVMPALASAVGAEAVAGIHQAIVGSILPEEMATSLSVMLPAMNFDDRAELLAGMQAGAPADVFAGVWSLTRSVLAPRDAAALGVALGLA